MAGITFVGGLFQTKKLKVFKSCKKTLDELATYQWEMDKTDNLIDKPKKSNDHLMDCLRYGIFTYSPPLENYSIGIDI